MYKPIKRMMAVLLVLIFALSSFPSALATEIVSDNTGTFRCDWFDESITYPYTYSDEWFSESSYDYNHDLATLSLCFSMASFESFNEEKPDENIRLMLEECGFDVQSYGYDTEGYDTVGVAFGKKAVSYNGTDYTLIIAAIRSGNYGMEWGGNMRIGTGVNHKGFDMAKELILQYLNDYITRNEIGENVKLLIPGYSRGASIANLTAASLDDGSYVNSLAGETDNIASLRLSKDNLYTYTFEAPQCTKSKDATDVVYSNIFNIVNPNDYVTKFVMDDWGFSYYGIEYSLPCAESCNTYNYYYKKICTEFDSMMSETGKKSGDYFYDRETSKSANATLDFIFAELSKNILISQEYYSEHYENAVIFIAGQYLGKKLGGTDAAKTVGTVIVATAIGIAPSNLEKIKSNGYRTYLSKYISESEAGANMTDSQIESLLDLLIKLIELINNNTYNVLSLLTQPKTILYVHQPYIALTWMRVLNADDIERMNNSDGAVISLDYYSLDIKHNTIGKLTANYNESDGYVQWGSADSNIATVDKNGNVSGGIKGSTIVTATLYDRNGNEIAKTSAKITVHMNIIQSIFYTIRSITG